MYDGMLLCSSDFKKRVEINEQVKKPRLYRLHGAKEASYRIDKVG